MIAGVTGGAGDDRDDDDSLAWLYGLKGGGRPAVEGSEANDELSSFTDLSFIRRKSAAEPYGSFALEDTSE